MRQAAELNLTVPEIRARIMDELARTIDAMAEALAKRTGRPADDLAVRTYVGAVFGVMLSVLSPSTYTPADMGKQQFSRIDEALALLEAGLPL